MNTHQYHLQKYTSPSSRHTCPQCGDKHSLVLYVDEQDNVLNERCGRCNHESSCGYHYPPKQFFADNPQRGSSHAMPHHTLMRPTPPPPPKPLCTLPADIVARAQRWHGNLCYFLSSRLTEEQAMRVLNLYHLGEAKSHATIFWQIDKQGRVRTGKIMQYDPQTGHRTDRLTWVHSLMKQHGQLSQDWELTQCLFGEHLLQERPADPVALVEGEKTAVICAALWPQFLWLATGGCGNLRADTAKALTGRTVIVFPDTGSFAKWKDKVKGFSFANFNVSDILEGKDLPDNYDIADYLMQELPPAPKFTAQDLADLANLYTD